MIGRPCAAGPQARFYTQKLGSRWVFCTPAGNAFWMNAVYHADASDDGADYQGIVLSDLVSSKYSVGLTTNGTLNWALQTVNRLKEWGFNTMAEYQSVWTLPAAVHPAWGTSDDTIPQKLPYVGFATPSLYSFSNVNNYANGPVKDLIAGVKTSVYNDYRSQSADFWDPNFAQYLKNELLNDQWISQMITGPHSDYLIGFNVDDTDNLQGFGAGPDFPTVNNGVIEDGNQQVHLGWIILVTAPGQTSGDDGVVYTDTKVYSKYELNNWLASRYGNNIAALNTAWGSKYTTFGAAGGWGSGSGVLDEDGTCPARTGKTCWVPGDAYTLTDATAQMRQDLDDFLLHHAQQYFSVVKSTLQSVAPGVLYLGPTSLGGWGRRRESRSCRRRHST